MESLWDAGDARQRGVLGHRRRDMVIEQDCHSENDEFGYAWAIILWSMLLCSCVSCLLMWLKYHKAKKQVDQERASLLHIHNGTRNRPAQPGPPERARPQQPPQGGSPDRRNPNRPNAQQANSSRPNTPPVNSAGPPGEPPRQKKQRSWQKRREESKAVATLGPRPVNRMEQEALKAQTSLMKLELEAQRRTLEIQKLDKELEAKSRERDLLQEFLKGRSEDRPVLSRQKVVEVEVGAQSERAIVEHVETPYTVDKVVENVVPVATLVPDPSAALKLEYALDDVRELRDAVADGPPPLVVPSARIQAYQQPPPITVASGWYGNPPPVLVIEEPPLYSDQPLYSAPLFADPILVEEDYFAPSRQTPSPAPMDDPSNRLLVDPSSPFSRLPAFANPATNPFPSAPPVTRPPIPLNSKDQSQSTLDPIFGGSPRTIYDTSIPTARA